MPADLRISDKAEELEIGKLTKVGFLMLNIASTYIILGSKTSREIPHWSEGILRHIDPVTTVMSSFK